MTAKLSQSDALLDDARLTRYDHALVVAPLVKRLADVPQLPQTDRLQRVLKRRDMKPEDLAKTPVAMHLEQGGLCVFVMVDPAKPRFDQLTSLRKALATLFEENPRALAIGVFGEPAQRHALAREAMYVAWVNGARLTVRKKKEKEGARPLQRIDLFGARDAAAFSDIAALARANTLARELTDLPPNELTPGDYRRRLRELARQQRWQIEEYDYKRLRRMGAGAFVAVAQGSHEEDAAMMHLSYRPKNARAQVALVGKGICFDTGGHNLKPAKYMAGMHEDMNGSAVALALLQAATERQMPLRIDAWLAIAQNHLSSQAYKQNDIITALDGTTIEIVHTDAEGRMVLADALTLAIRGGESATAKAGAGKPRSPDLIIDFATLTGSMISALGTRYSGIFASDAELAALAVSAGQASGERVCSFPLDADYEAALDSKVADIKQCTLEGEADHILAARFLKRFTGDRPWLHMDLSAANCSGGLGAIATDITGFGVAWGVEMLNRWSAKLGLESGGTGRNLKKVV